MSTKETVGKWGLWAKGLGMGRQNEKRYRGSEKHSIYKKLQVYYFNIYTGKRGGDEGFVRRPDKDTKL